MSVLSSQLFPLICLPLCLHVRSLHPSRYSCPGNRFISTIFLDSTFACPPTIYSVVSDSLATPRTVAPQAPLSMECSRQEYWRGLPFPLPEDLPHAEKKENQSSSSPFVHPFQKPRGLRTPKEESGSLRVQLWQQRQDWGHL